MSRHSVCEYITNKQRCFGMGALYIWRANRFYLRSADVLSKAYVGRAAFKNETVNWPGYGLLQLNLKHYLQDNKGCYRENLGNAFGR